MHDSVFNKRKQAAISILCEEFKKHNYIDPIYYHQFDIKRGLRNADGSGVIAGLTLISNVHGYVMNEGEKEAQEGDLSYRGHHIFEIVNRAVEMQKYAFEEVIYLLLFGVLPEESELAYFKEVLAMHRQLPDGFIEDMILKMPSRNIMNKLQSAILSLYTYDQSADNTTIDQELTKAIGIIAKLPIIMTAAYHAKQKAFENESLILHPVRKEESVAQSILSTLRHDRQYTEEEAHLLDIMLVLHAEHGGGNNSTFTCRTLTSSGTDAYSAYAGAIGSLKGPRHGGANLKVMQMLDFIEAGVKDWEDEDEIASFLKKIVLKQAGDGSGLIYGMGHAVYTKSDPRAVILKDAAMRLAKTTEYEAEFKLLNKIEKIAPKVFNEQKKTNKVMCANVDLYSGLVYKMLKIPKDLYTPLFAIARISGWAAHRMEEILTGGKIIRPAYKSVLKRQAYMFTEDR